MIHGEALLPAEQKVAERLGHLPLDFGAMATYAKQR